MELACIVAINQLLALYGHAADAAKSQPVDSTPQQRLDEVFTEDAVFDLTALGGDRLDGLDAIRAMLAAPGHPPSHQTTNTYVYEAEGVTRAKSKFHVMDWSGNTLLGEYHDALVKQGDEWRISERVVVQLGGRFEGSAAITAAYRSALGTG